MKDSQTALYPLNFKHRFPALDGIRALAVTLTFLQHFGGGSHGGKVLNLINDLRLHFWVGVDLFFAISGFLITGILFDTQKDSRFFQRFFARRSVRIFPIFYLVLFILLCITPFMHYQWHWGHLSFLVYLGNIFANVNSDYYGLVSSRFPVFRVNFSHFWSLCVEEQFYLLWPVIVWITRDRIKLIRVGCGLIAFAFASRVILYIVFGQQIASTWSLRALPFRMDGLILGSLLALLLRGPNAEKWQRRCKPLFVIASALTLAIFIFSPAGDSPWLLTIGLTLIACAATGLIGITLRANSFTFRVFHLKPFRILGKYSYGFYVYHAMYEWAWIQFLVFLMQRLHSIALAGIIALGTNFCVTFLVAKLSYDLFEVKFLRLKKNFEYDSELTEHKHAFTTT